MCYYATHCLTSAIIASYIQCISCLSLLTGTELSNEIWSSSLKNFVLSTFEKPITSFTNWHWFFKTLSQKFVRMLGPKECWITSWSWKSWTKFNFWEQQPIKSSLLTLCISGNFVWYKKAVYMKENEEKSLEKWNYYHLYWKRSHY